MITQSRTNNIRMLKLLGVFVLFLIIIIYVILNGLNYARGPRINIFFPSQSFITSSSTITISGQALRIIKITLNGSPISVDENGKWKQEIVVFPGINQIDLYAEDQFGRNINKKLDIVGITNQ